jgi:hypothetical protein
LLGPDRRAPPPEPAELFPTEVFGVVREASYRAGRDSRVPSVTRVADRLIGPGALLRVLKEALRNPSGNIHLRPGPELPKLATREDFSALKFQQTWSILPPEFEAPGIIDLARLQTWSARPG